MADIINPQEVQRRRQASIQEDIQQQQYQEELQAKNYANSVRIDYESMGRFSTPPTLYFKDYTNKHINDMTLTNNDDLFEVLLTVLQELKQNEPDFKIEDMTAEDFIETLFAIKIKFEGQHHLHRWICKCQYDVDSKDQIVNEHTLDLMELQYKSIEQVEEEIKKELQEVLSSLSPIEFKNYLITKYKNNPIDDIDNYTVAMEIEKTKIGEPFNIISGEDVYTFRYPRIKDILKAKRYTDKIYNPKLKNLDNRKEHGVPLTELKEKKQKERDKLKEEQAKHLILYAKSMMLISKNYMELTDEQKFIEFKDNMTRATSKAIDDIFSKLRFGLNTELELTCPICGTVDKRLLHRELDPRELIPVQYSDSESGDITHRKSGINTGNIFYFGI